MNMNALRGFLLVWVCSMPLVTACSASSGDFKYRVTAANYGTKGVVIRKLSHVPATETGVKGLSIPIVQNVYPALPTVPPSTEIGHFEGFDDKLPRKVEITWQLASLSHCFRVNRSANYPGHVDKLGCTWTLLDDQIYHQQLDMDAIRASKAYRRTGELVMDSGSQYYNLYLQLIFHGDRLKVRVINGTTMGLGQ